MLTTTRTYKKSPSVCWGRITDDFYKAFVLLIFLFIILISFAGCALKQDVDIFRGELKAVNDRLVVIEETALKVDIVELQKNFEIFSDKLLKQNASLQADVDNLYTQVADNRGEINQRIPTNTNYEQIEQELKTIKSQIERIISKVNTLEGADNISKNDDMSSSEDSNNPLAARIKIYENAYSSYLSAQYGLAIEIFSKFLKEYPTGEYAANAQYWLGECFYSSGKYDEAITEFGKLLKNFPDSTKIPTAYLKIGYSFSSKGDSGAAKDAFQIVIDKYSGSDEAVTASLELKKINKR